jgi:hypothetical protein
MRGDNGRVIGNGRGPHVVSLSKTAAVEVAIDDALDGLVTSMDDLARDLAFDEFEEPPGAPPATRPRPSVVYGPVAATAHGNAYLVGVMSFLIVFELLLLWMLLHG